MFDHKNCTDKHIDVYSYRRVDVYSCKRIHVHFLFKSKKRKEPYAAQLNKFSKTQDYFRKNNTMMVMVFGVCFQSFLDVGF